MHVLFVGIIIAAEDMRRIIMSVKNALLKRFIVNKISNSLTGDIKNLKKLVTLSERFDVQPSVKNFMNNLKNAIDEDRAFARLFLRIGKAMSPSYRKKIVRNLIYNQFIEGAKKRESLSVNGNWVPGFFVVSPTMRCNLRCTGCYAGLYTKEGDLPEKELDRILGEARDTGIYFTVISGGEPYLLKSSLLRIFKKYNDMFFLTYTNGTFLDKTVAKELAGLGNVAAAISVEGYEEETDNRRGRGVYGKIMKAMDNLKREGVLFGISVTYTRYNIDVVTDDKFIEYYMNKGAIFGWYFMFMPVGKDPILDLVPTPEQRVYTGKKVAALREKYPMFLADFWNDGPAAGGCLAGGRQYLHILNSGNVEPCVFAHFCSGNIKGKTLLEVANSPFFKAIRQRFPYNGNGNLKRPCMIIDNPEVLRDLVDEYGVVPGHDHSESIVHDPEVIDWVNNYSEEFKKLTDPEWEKEINDPDSRWYKEGAEYKQLFRFRQKARKETVGTGSKPGNLRKAEEKVPV